MRAIEAEVKYEGYLLRQKRDIDKLARMDDVLIPASLDFREIPGLTQEAILMLERSRPKTVGQARVVRGVTPAALTSLAIFIKVEKRREKQQQCST